MRMDDRHDEERARDSMRRMLEIAGTVPEQELREELICLDAQPLNAAMLAGYVQAMRDAFIAVPGASANTIDTCGTGGDSAVCSTFNISTAAAILASACGVTVAKHGNRASTSRCGSADVLDALGIPLSTTPAQAAARLREHNFAFLFAPAFHPALAPLAPVRKVFGRRTVFNLLGPLANPAATQRQVIGVPTRELVPIFAGALALLGETHALVVHGHKGMDEITLTGETHAAEVRDGILTRDFTLAPKDFGMSTHAAPEPYAGGDAAHNAEILTRLFTSPIGCVYHREVVIANTAAALVVAGRAADFREGAAIALHTLDSGAAASKLVELQHQEKTHA